MNLLPMEILNILKIKGNQRTKFGQLITEIFFFKNYAENEAGKLVTPVCFLFFKKALH